MKQLLKTTLIILVMRTGPAPAEEHRGPDLEVNGTALLRALQGDDSKERLPALKDLDRLTGPHGKISRPDKFLRLVQELDLPWRNLAAALAD